jgi:hypothetical protein
MLTSFRMDVLGRTPVPIIAIASVDAHVGDRESTATHDLISRTRKFVFAADGGSWRGPAPRRNG